MMKGKVFIFMTAALLLIACGYSDEPQRDYQLQGAWLLQHKAYPSGSEQHYSIEGAGTYCQIFYGDSTVGECWLTRAPSGLVITPTGMWSVTLTDKGGGEWLYLEDGDPHPLNVVGDTAITIQRNGVVYYYQRADNIYQEWGVDIRSIIAREVLDTEPHHYVLSARERRQASYIQWLVMAVGIVTVLLLSSHVVYRRRRRQLQLQLQQIREVQENRPQEVRQAVKSIEDSYFASDDYAALQRRMATGQLMKEVDWRQVEHQLKSLYPAFTTQLRNLYPMSEMEYQACLLIKLRIPTKNIAAVLARDVSTISAMRSRLYKKVFGRKGGAKDWDEFILSIEG